ncbi:DUF4129 domain-containing protein [Curtobacterium sp. Leaf261]|uniref:DUF4129 domain-containing protein n=1 Tax=Curtobacterium sp. Leaf261 TaxID=1736311 RepID=UPI0006F4A4CF|nr:DUF4129 domain-containing protein [Curtobacterium sp. Leaf261]KQO62143.1 hypothetical protein ASF23_09925 [Curtobacterium sp. Leaf261]
MTPGATVGLLVGRMLTVSPRPAVSPGDARRLLQDELRDRAYDAARPTWWDRVSKSFLDWIGSFRIGGDAGVDRILLVVGIVVVLAVVVLLVVVVGLPRRRAVQRGASGSVFDADDRRDARALSAAAAAAAARGDWDQAVVDAFRALVRGLAERDLVPDVPGATARTIATDAGASFPGSASALTESARRFDAVRYAGVDADESDYRVVTDTDTAVRRVRPVEQIAVPA